MKASSRRPAARTPSSGWSAATSTPGGTAEFEILFPVNADDVGGDFEITDCVFIDDEATLKYFVHFVPNNQLFKLELTLNIPVGTPIGAEICNYAKTTASPSASQASNRKAGPACFIVGGNIGVLKTNEAGDPLSGATFHIVCTLPTTDAFLPDTIINGEVTTRQAAWSSPRNKTTGANGRDRHPGARRHLVRHHRDRGRRPATTSPTIRRSRSWPPRPA